MFFVTFVSFLKREISIFFFSSKNGEVNILIATDVASRGIDIGDITHVINYDFPNQIEEYVHVRNFISLFPAKDK